MRNNVSYVISTMLEKDWEEDGLLQLEALIGVMVVIGIVVGRLYRQRRLPPGLPLHHPGVG